jgi:hypothetical protein
VHCEKLGKLLHEETEIHVLSFTLQSVWHLADVGVLVHVRFAPEAAIRKSDGIAMSAFHLPAQPVDATQALNLSAGVSNCKV